MGTMPSLGGKVLDLETQYHFDPESNSIINDKHRRIAEIVQDYNPELSVVWIPNAERTSEDVEPYMIVHTQSDGRQYPVMKIREDEMDERVLSRLFYSDMSRQNPNAVISTVEAAEAAAEIYKAKEYEEEMAEKRDLFKHILDSPKSTYRHNGKVYGNGS